MISDSIADRVVGIDTSALIPAFAPGMRWHRESDELLATIRAGHARAVIPMVAAAEALVRPLRRRLSERIVAIQLFLLTTPNVDLVPVSWPIAMRGAALRAAHGIQLPDSLIIATAAGCGALVSADQRALAVAEAEGIEPIEL